jgi:hypothetical protein
MIVDDPHNSRSAAFRQISFKPFTSTKCFTRHAIREPANQQAESGFAHAQKVFLRSKLLCQGVVLDVCRQLQSGKVVECRIVGYRQRGRKFSEELQAFEETSVQS